MYVLKESKCVREPDGGFIKVVMELSIKSDGVQATVRVIQRGGVAESCTRHEQD